MKRNLISVVVNTLNEEENLARCLNSVKRFADEIVVVDMHSRDKTREIAEGFGAKVFMHKKVDYVEPARNFAINKAKGQWIFLIDADEEAPSTLVRKLKTIAQDKENKDLDCVLIPRKNIILGKWMQNSRWWPDYLPRFFRKGKITWPKQIHQQPNLSGKKIRTLVDSEEMAIIHHNYKNLDQFLDRGRRYAGVQARELVKEKKYIFSPRDFLLKPTNEFLSRFFVGEAYKDGVHGLALSLLQAWVVFLTYLRVWEMSHYEEKALETKKIKQAFSRVVYQTEYWRDDFIIKSKSSYFAPLAKLLLKIRAWLLKL